MIDIHVKIFSFHMELPMPIPTQPKTSPLSPKAKEDLFNKLKKVKDAPLEAALIKLALIPHVFPASIDPALDGLQMVYLINQDVDAIKQNLRECITLRIKETGLKAFKALLQEPFNEVVWKSTFLTALAAELKLKQAEEPLVEAM